jgi:hypothetical protein
MKQQSLSTAMAIAVILSIFAFTVLPAVAQQTTGTPGSPGATTTIDGRYLPNPPQTFRGDIQTNAMQSTPAWPALSGGPGSDHGEQLIIVDLGQK